MSDDIQKKIFSRNLNYYVNQSGKQQKEIAKILGYSEKTFNGWCRGLSIPTMGKIQTLADFFNIGKSDLLEDKQLSEMADSNKNLLLKYYDSLNDAGKEEMIKHARLLDMSGEYKK